MCQLFVVIWYSEPVPLKHKENDIAARAEGRTRTQTSPAVNFPHPLHPTNKEKSSYNQYSTLIPKRALSPYSIKSSLLKKASGYGPTVNFTNRNGSIRNIYGGPITWWVCISFCSSVLTMKWKIIPVFGSSEPLFDINAILSFISYQE